MKLEVGKLYQCKDYFLLLYPDPETADAARVPLGGGEVVAAAAFWSKRFGKPVLFSEKNIPLLILNDKEEYVEVLAGDRKGWIICEDWLNIKEIV